MKFSISSAVELSAICVGLNLIQRLEVLDVPHPQQKFQTLTEINCSLIARLKITHCALTLKCLTANRAPWWLLLRCGLFRVHVNVPACFVLISPAPGVALALWRHSLWPRPVQAGALPAESLCGHHRPQPVRPQRGQVSDWRARLI